MRWLLAAVLLWWCCAAAVADNQHPTSWHVTREWTSYAMPLGDSWVLHRKLPAWQSSDPVLAVVDNNGKIIRRALDGQDVRAVAVWRSLIIAVRLSANAVELVVLNDRLHTLGTVRLPELVGLSQTPDVQVMSRDERSHILILCNGFLLACNPVQRPLNITVLEQRVFGAAVGRGEWSAIFVHDVGGIAYASLVDTLMRRRVAPSVPLASHARIGQVNDDVVVISAVEGSYASQVSVIDSRSSVVQTLTLPVSENNIGWVEQKGKLALAVVSTQKGMQTLAVASADNIHSAMSTGIALPPEVAMPQRVWASADTVGVWCSGGIVSVVGGSIIAADVLHRNLAGYEVPVPSGRGLLVYGPSGTLVITRMFQPWWWIWWLAMNVAPFVIPLLLLLIIVLLVTQLRRQKRYLSAMLEVPGAGLVFVIDGAGKLTQANERAMRLLRITPKVPMHRLFRAYMRHRGVEGVLHFVEQAMVARRPITDKVSVDDDDDQREYMFTSQLLWGTLGKRRATVVTGIDITEALERRRLVNWAQLAHDMQTNLSTIRLNAEQIGLNLEAKDSERVRRILFQTDVLIQRVRDLVSVGRSEELQKSAVHSAEFCTQLRHEFDPLMFPHVTFVMKLRGTTMMVDKLKLSRAVRNAVENAIKSLRGNPGTVEIATWFDRTHVHIRISDTGIGMDTLTLENMMKPYFTSAKDGTGTGIGTMIMQHVTHMHGGSLRVTSEPGVGTQVDFRIPIGTVTPSP